MHQFILFKDIVSGNATRLKCILEVLDAHASDLVQEYVAGVIREARKEAQPVGASSLGAS